MCKICGFNKSCIIETSNSLKWKFGNRIMPWRGNINWSPRFWDLTPSDFFLFGYLKEKVYVNNPQTIAELQKTIFTDSSSWTAVMPKCYQKCCQKNKSLLCSCMLSLKKYCFSLLNWNICTIIWNKSFDHSQIICILLKNNNN